MSLLSCTGLSAGYGEIVAVHELNLEVAEGEVVALLGANGAGKSTALRAISGMLPPRAGDILVDGRSIRGMTPEKVAGLGVAHVPEGRGIFSNLSVVDNLRMGLYGAGRRSSNSSSAIEEACALFPILKARGDQKAGTLSGGEQQMLAIARALIQSPRLLLLDEMSMGLAPAVVQQLFAVVAEVAKGGTSVLMVEQFVGQALKIASRAYVLEKGRVAFAGEASALAGRGEVTEAYLGHGPDGHRRSGRKGAERVAVPVDPGLLRRLERRAERAGQTLEEVLAAALDRGTAEGTLDRGTAEEEPAASEGKAPSRRKRSGRVASRHPGR